LTDRLEAFFQGGGRQVHGASMLAGDPVGEAIGPVTPPVSSAPTGREGQRRAAS